MKIISLFFWKRLYNYASWLWIVVPPLILSVHSCHYLFFRQDNYYLGIIVFRLGLFSNNFNHVFDSWQIRAWHSCYSLGIRKSLYIKYNCFWNFMFVLDKRIFSPFYKHFLEYVNWKTLSLVDTNLTKAYSFGKIRGQWAYKWKGIISLFFRHRQGSINYPFLC